MRPVGFSTGALARGDFGRGLALTRARGGLRAVELSALRDHEVTPLVEAARGLDLTGFEYVSFHAPSRLGALGERAVFALLETLPAEWPIIVHPELLHTPDLWRSLGARLCLENMDDRKTLGRTADELRAMFEVYPDAGFCLDVGHARQIDPTMAGALRMLIDFGGRLRQLHVSEVGAKGEHLPLGTLARWACARVAGHVPEGCPLIIESVVEEGEIEREVAAVVEAFGLQGPTR